MEPQHPIQVTLEEMVRAILRDCPGFVPLGNVWMEWDGTRLSWDIPVHQWDVDAMCASLMRQAKRHPEIETIAKCAEALARL
ncbi:MAG: hypothetical protein D6704_01900 [Nitrospirae bacterium]|nr:MAG: hypothetical protein D6704_01900 [Nitrospirota bacterium]